MQLKFTIRFVLLCVCSLVISFCDNKAGDKNDAKEENKDKFDTQAMEKQAKFFVNAVSSNMAEIKLSELGQQKTTDGEIRTLCEMMIKDHTALLNDLKSLAASKNITVPTTIQESDENLLGRLAKDKPNDFEKNLIRELEQRHEKSVKLFEEESSSTADADVKSLVDKSLPVIRHHMEMVKNTRDKYQAR